MEAFYFWSGPSFSLLEYLSVLSTVRMTTYDHIVIYFDDDCYPDSDFWTRLDQLQKVSKVPTSALARDYADRFDFQFSWAELDKRTMSDVFRYCRLFLDGGTWFDFDTFQVRDVRRLAEEREFLAGWEDDNFIAIGLLAFPPRHCILDELLQELNAALRLKSPPVSVVGPRLFTEVTKRLGKHNEVLPTEYFYPIHYEAGDFVVRGIYPIGATTYSIHVWGYFHRSLFAGKQLADFRDVDSTFFSLARLLDDAQSDVLLR